MIKGVLGQPHGRETSRVYRNLGDNKFADVTKDVGLDDCFSAMGTNFGDFDNDGYLDFYLGTGDHDIAANRDRAKNFRARRDIDPVANRRRTTRSSAGRTAGGTTSRCPRSRSAFAAPGSGPR